MVTVPTLKLVRESKICDLLPCDRRIERWEASGVLVKDRHFFVVFDDRTEIARLSDDLQPSSTNGLFGMAHGDSGYEGITYNAAKRRYYLLVESREQPSGHYQASIVEYDDEFRYLKDRPVDFRFKSSNKGFEAVAHVRRDDQDFLLALCEGNKCKSGEKGRKPGGGRVQVFEKKKSAGLTPGPSRCRPVCRSSIIRGCLSIMGALRSSRRSTPCFGWASSMKPAGTGATTNNYTSFPDPKAARFDTAISKEWVGSARRKS